MKLIIDIPDEVLESKHYCQYFGVWSTKLTETIANGTPYNPTGDCISREALKVELETYRHTRNYKSDEDEAQNNLLDNVLEDIDNAPPVEPEITEEQAINKLHETGWLIGHDKEMTERPKGEWIYHDKLNMYFCKDCGLLEPLTKEEVEEGAKLPNFCEQCGADMRKGGAE